MGRTEESLAEAIREELGAHGTLVPPWVKHPNIARYSIGWRMGSGAASENAKRRRPRRPKIRIPNPNPEK